MAYGRVLIYALCCTAVYTIPLNEDCKDVKCEGPLRYYKEIGCKPVYKNPGDCCAHKYDCDFLGDRKPNKCHVNDHEYDIGDSLREEDRNPCDIGCTCREIAGKVGFVCAVVDCFSRYQPDCYNPHNASQCCPGAAICPEKKEDIPTCLVDGKTLRAGAYFSPSAEPEKDCYCGEGYTGENIAPFCRTRGHSLCGVELHHQGDVDEKCAPVYYSPQSPQDDCSYAYRCQNPRDEVVARASLDGKAVGSSDDILCSFGNLTLRVGEELNQATHYDSVCVKCTCEVPPVPTCQRLPDDVCDVTVHPDFSKY